MHRGIEAKRRSVEVTTKKNNRKNEELEKFHKLEQKFIGVKYSLQSWNM